LNGPFSVETQLELSVLKEPHRALADVGSRLILSAGGNAQGVPMIEKARAIVPDLTRVDTVAIAVDALWRSGCDDKADLGVPDQK
jgi:hypothetical protein